MWSKKWILLKILHFSMEYILSNIWRILYFWHSQIPLVKSIYSMKAHHLLQINTTVNVSVIQNCCHKDWYQLISKLETNDPLDFIVLSFNHYLTWKILMTTSSQRKVSIIHLYNIILVWETQKRANLQVTINFNSLLRALKINVNVASKIKCDNNSTQS